MKLKNLTPEQYLCFGGIGCPAVYATEDGSYILIGKRLAADDPRVALISNRSPGEEVIEIPAGLLDNLKAEVR